VGSPVAAGRWRAGRLIVAVAVAAGIVAGLAAPAAAHAQLESTTPAAGAVVDGSPGHVVLHFSEAVEVSFSSVQVFDANAKRIDAGDAGHVPGDARSVEVGVPASMAAGGYVVTWRVTSADSHPVHGAFTFQIAGAAGGTGQAGAGSALRGEAARLLAHNGGSRTVGFLAGLTRFAVFAGLALLVGGTLFAIAIWPGARADRRARRLLWWGLGLAAVATAAGFLLQGPYAAGLGLNSLIKPSVLSAVWHTRFGRVQVIRLVLLGAAVPVTAGLLRCPPDQRVPTPLLVAGGAVGTALLVSTGLAGHTGTGSAVALAIPFDAIHTGGAAVWFGGLTMVLVAVLPASLGDRAGPDSPLRQAVPRFSQWALGAVIAIAASGAYAAWRQVGTLAALPATAYGRILLAKTAIFGAVIALAALNRTAVHGGLAVPGRARGRAGRVHPAAALSTGPGALAADPDTRLRMRLRPAVGAEVALLAVVLALSALLVNAQPARQSYARPFTTEVHAGPNLVDVTIDPAKAGPISFHVYVLTADGAQLDVPEVTATMAQTAAGIDALKVPLVKAGPGHFNANGFDVPIRGAWQVRILVRTTDVEEFYADPFTVRVR